MLELVCTRQSCVRRNLALDRQEVSVRTELEPRGDEAFVWLAIAYRKEGDSTRAQEALKTRSWEKAEEFKRDLESEYEAKQNGGRGRRTSRKKRTRTIDWLLLLLPTSGLDQNEPCCFIGSYPRGRTSNGLFSKTRIRTDH
jgi:hypothetical protein